MVGFKYKPKSKRLTAHGEQPYRIAAKVREKEKHSMQRSIGCFFIGKGGSFAVSVYQYPSENQNPFYIEYQINSVSVYQYPSEDQNWTTGR